MTIVSIALLVAIVILLLVVLFKISRVGSPMLDSRLDAFEKAQDRTERAVRDEVAQSREELGRAAKEQRQELAGAFTIFGDSFAQRMMDAASLQKAQLDVFSEQLASFASASAASLDNARAESAIGAKQLREEVVATLRSISETMTNTMSSLASAQKAQLEAFGNQLASFAQASGEKLDGVRTESSTGAMQLREEVVAALKGITDTTTRTMGELANLQKGQLETMSSTIERLSETNDKKLEAVRGTVEDALRRMQEDNAKQLDPKLHHFEFRAADMRRDISEKKRQGKNEPASPVIKRHTSTWWTDIDPADHYTLVEIRNIKDSCDELLDPDVLTEYIGDIGPVDFSPEFEHGSLISDNLRIFVPDYSPKTIYLSRPDGKKVHVYKPYNNEMKVATPQFLDVRDPDNATELLAYCWYTSNAEEILGKMRATGKIFSVPGEKVEDRRRFAGLIYKLFGFSIGDRSLPERTLWTTARARALWFTGEIHIVDKNVQPTTSRSDFIENAARAKLYKQAQNRITMMLNSTAQTISDNRKAFQDAKNIRLKLEKVKTQLENGGIERSDIRVIREELERSFRKLASRKNPTDKEIGTYQKEVRRIGEALQDDLNNPKKLKQGQSVSDLVKELDMPTKARKVFQIVMETLQQHYSKDNDEYHEVAAKIRKALKDKYV